MRHELCCGPCELWLPQLRDERINCIFADPPDNIGLDYGDGGQADRMRDDEYVLKLIEWVDLFVECADSIWISFNSKWLLEMAHIVNRLVCEHDDLSFKPCVQTFSFYQHCKTHLGNAHRPLWLLQWKGVRLYPDQIKIPSWRQQHNDSRAVKGGKVPGDVFDFTQLPEKQRRDWHERAIQCGEWVVDPLIPDDHFDFTRVVGNAQQRRKWHPTQLNEGLVERAVKLVTKLGDWVVDPFGGTGTTLRVCRKIGRVCSLIETSPNYCTHIAAEHEMGLREKGKYARWHLTEVDP